MHKIIICILLTSLFSSIGFSQTQAQAQGQQKQSNSNKSDKGAINLQTGMLKLIERQFYPEMPIENINKNKIPACKKVFYALCGKEDFPGLIKFNLCLQKNYAQIKKNPGCDNLAHALIHMLFVTLTPRSVPQCRVYYEKCSQLHKKDNGLGINYCVQRTPNLPPACLLLISEVTRYRTLVTRIYDSKLSVELPNQSNGIKK